MERQNHTDSLTGVGWGWLDLTRLTALDSVENLIGARQSAGPSCQALSENAIHGGGGGGS
jgi:hypothetical protein